MPPPPPPPPPPGGPPPPPMPNFAAPSSGAPNRSALLSEIRVGARLKKTVTNDRSAPIVSNKPNNAGSGAPGGSTPGGLGGAGPMGLGGLFAGGMPKLKPTGQRAALGVASSSSALEKSSSPSASPPKESSPPRGRASLPVGNAHSNLAAAIANRAVKMNEAVNGNGASKVGAGWGHAPKSTAATGQSPSPDRERPSPQTEEHGVSFPKDVSPPQLPQHKMRSGPPLPSKPPAAAPMSGSNRPSQPSTTSKGSAAQRPTNKPPPPPKNISAKFGTIGHPSKGNVRPNQTQQLIRRQSLGASDANGPPATANFTVSKPQTAPPPPPPPRNMSVPSNMHQLHRQPPPVPAAPPAMSLAAKKPSPPGGLGPIPGSKPPPPPNKTTSRSTPHLAGVGIVGPLGGGGIESRFAFHNINDLSVTYEPTPNKNYPTKKAKKPHQRRAPAPPSAAAFVS